MKAVPFIFITWGLIWLGKGTSAPVDFNRFLAILGVSALIANLFEHD